MAGHRKLQVRFCNIIDSWHQTVWRHRYQLSDVGCQHVKMSRCQRVTFQYAMRDAICFKQRYTNLILWHGIGKITGFMVNGKETLLQTDYITKRADLPKKGYGICWSFLERKTRIHFIDTERTKVNSQSYKNLLEIGLLPDCRWLYPNGDWVSSSHEQDHSGIS